MKQFDDTIKKEKKFSYSSLSKTGKKVHSNAEKFIADYLDLHGMEYIKPSHASKGQYYRNYAFIPDFVVHDIVVEFFGIKGDADYERIKHLKKQNAHPNKDYIFLENLNQVGTILTKLKDKIGKKEQIELTCIFENIIKEDLKFKELIKNNWNDKIKNKLFEKFQGSKYKKELDDLHKEIFTKFMEFEGKQYLKELLKNN